MLATHPRWQLVPGAIEMHQDAWRHPAVIVARTRTRGLATMELGGGASPAPRTWVWIVREGEAHLETTRGGVIVRAGEVFVGSEEHARLVRTSERCDLLQVVGARSRDGVFEHAPLDVGQRACARSLADALGGSPDPAPIATLLDVLTPPGLDRARVLDAAQTRADGVDQRIADLVARACSHLDRHPGVDDLAAWLGIPERRASERVGSYFRRHHASFDGWRSYVATLRVELAWNLLGGRRLRAAEIASRLGYRSAPALYHALHRRGLTPP